jgi:FtsZ-interacting cell division protein ZipA
MDISTFRWVLIIAGIAIIAGIYLFGIRDKKRKPRASRKRVHAQRVRQEPALDSAEAGDGGDGGDPDTRQTELAIDDTSEKMFRVDPRFEGETEPAKGGKPTTPSGPPPEKIVTLFLQARDNHIITGVDLLDASLKSGLIFGGHDIFHRIHEEDLNRYLVWRT